REILPAIPWRQWLKGKAYVITGVRRAGKSTLLREIKQNLIAECGAAKENFIHINFFDDRLSFLPDRLGLLLEAYFGLYPDKRRAEKIYFLLDELQEIDGWEAFVDRILRTENCAVIISGSTAKLLTQDASRQMRGRSLSWELYPFSFSEFYRLKNRKVLDLLSPEGRGKATRCFDMYWEAGGFPEASLLEPSLRVKLHQEYFATILARDISERTNTRNPRAVQWIARRLLQDTACHFSTNQLVKELKNEGFPATKAFVNKVLAAAEDAYLFFPVYLNSPSLRKRMANTRKIYCIDSALVRSVRSSHFVNEGLLFENLVYIELRRRGFEVFYHRTKSGREVDFCFRDQKTGEITLLQAAYSLKEPATREREIQGLLEAEAELK
ncbi:MAG: ATP-binding protein, partial [Bdellovibrionota bacterium]